MGFLTNTLDSVAIDRLAWLGVFYPYVVIDSIGKNGLMKQLQLSCGQFEIHSRGMARAFEVS